MQLINREVSWLSFNERVLQEAEDSTVPLIERMRFLGIFSNNRDEFFRVRVASISRLIELSTGAQRRNHENTLEQIQEIGLNQERKFNKIYKKLTKELSGKGIHLVNESELSAKQISFVKKYFLEKVRPNLVPIILQKGLDFPELKNNQIYLAVEMLDRSGKLVMHSIIEIPTQSVSRFLVLPNEEKERFVILLDDIIRLNLENIFTIFDYESIKAYTFKISRDAELDIDDDISESWIEKMSKSVKNRKTGNPVRFVYDKKMPLSLLAMLKKKMGVKKEEYLSPGSRYHNFRDFMDFPDVGAKELRFQKLKPSAHPFLRNTSSVMQEVEKQDVLLSYPYQKFDYVIDLLREAAIDPKVESIAINLYRVAKNSKIINALINAAKNGKRVTVIMELLARFDEQNNIHWSNKLNDEGVRVIHGVPGLKVHSKLILVNKYRGNKLIQYAHIGTGNFHEGTAKIYGDYSLLTTNPKIASEVSKVFDFFEVNYKRVLFKHLIVSPFNVRRRFNDLIQNEIRNAKLGKQAFITLKLNNLVDELFIKKLYDASNAGVKVRLIIRGICALVPGIKHQSENIKVFSIVDRFLEHARVMKFCNGGDPLYYIGSADWMTRNIDKRIEVSTPILDNKLKKIIDKMLDFQLADNVKRRKLNVQLNNNYVIDEKVEIRSQIETYNYFKQKLNN